MEKTRYFAIVDKLRIERGIPETAFLIPGDSLIRWMSNESQPVTSTMLAKLNEILIEQGLSPVRIEGSMPSNSRALYNLLPLKALLWRHNFTLARVADAFPVTRRTMALWMSANSTITPDRLGQLKSVITTLKGAESSGLAAAAEKFFQNLQPHFDDQSPMMSSLEVRRSLAGGHLDPAPLKDFMYRRRISQGAVAASIGMAVPQFNAMLNGRLVFMRHRQERIFSTLERMLLGDREATKELREVERKCEEGQG